MPLYSIQGPDGKTYSITGPEGATRDQVIAEITKQLGSSPVAPTTSEQNTEPSSLMRRAGDVGLSTAQGVVGLGEAAVGLADIPTFGLAGKAAAAGEKALFGGTSQDAQKYLESLKTPETRKAEQNVQEAKGFLGTSKAYLENPSALVGTIAESIPSMIGGAGVGKLGIKGAEALGKKVGTLAASAAGEGAVSAGSTAEAIRQQEDNGLLSPGQAAIATASGALTGALGVFGGKVADKLGVQDIDRLIMGDVRKVGEHEAKHSILTSAIKGALSESAFEELPQSMQEQIAQNVATGKPWDQGVAEAGASGAMAAFFMGGAGAAASQVVTNANIKAEEKKNELATAQDEIKPGKNTYEEQDETPVDTSFSFGANEVPDAVEKINQNYEANKDKFASEAAKDDMIDPHTGFPLFAGSQQQEQAQQEYDAANAQLDVAIKSGKENEYDLALERVKKARETLAATNGAVDRGELGQQAPLFAGKDEEQKPIEDIYGPERKFTTRSAITGEPWTYFGPGAEVNQNNIPGQKARVVEVHEEQNSKPGYTLEIDTSNLAEAKDDNGNQINSTRVYVTAEELNRLNPPSPQQAPLFAGQQGFDFGAPTDERAQAIEPNKPTTGQQGLDFNQEVPTGEYTPPPTETPKFGYTTETSVTPLMQFLAQVKPRSTSDAEKTKQQQAIAGLNDEIAGLFDGIDEKDIPYFKGVVDSFFDNYASGTNLPSKQGDLKNLNNLNATDQKAVLEKHTHLPDLTTYEGAKKLADAFQDHVADAQLAGLGITRSSSAYNQMDPIVRNLRNKSKSQYDEEDRAAHSYFSMFNLDTALRAAAFDVATNTPRSQLFRGQGKDAAELFNGWLINNDAPLGVQMLFNNYVHAYKKQNEGFKAFQDLMDNAENEAEYVKGYTEGPKASAANERAYMGSAPLHPAAIMHIKNNNMNSALRVVSFTSKSNYQRNLAKRLLELNLKTSIGENTVEQLAEDYTQNTRNLLGKFCNMAMGLLPQSFTADDKHLFLDSWDKGNINSSYRNRTRFADAAYVVQIVKEKLHSNGIYTGAIFDVLKDLNNCLDGVNVAFTARGVYFPVSDSISINTNVSPMISTVFLHEVMHAATANVVAQPNHYSPKQQAAVAELKDLFDIAKKEAMSTGEGSRWYGLTNLDEFIAEAFTNGHFQDFLKKIKYKYANQSLWDKFVTYCLKIVGYDNVLSATIANVNAIFATPSNKEYTVAPPLFAARNAGMFEGNSAERLKATDVLNDLIQNNEKWDDVKDKFAHAIETLNTQTRKHWLGAFTLRQMEEMLGKVYTLNPETGKMEYQSKVPQLAKFLNSIEAMTSERSKVIHEATTISKELLNIQRENKPTVEKLTQIIQTATVNEVDPTKPAPAAKDPNNPTKDEQEKLLMHRTLVKEYSNLGNMKGGKEAQELYVKMRDFFKERLNEFKKIAYTRELDRLVHDAKLDQNAPDYPAQLAAIEATAQTNIDEKFKDSIDPYFPLKRFGEFWVRYGSGDSRQYMQFESAAAKNKFLDKVEADYAKKLQALGFKPEQIATEIKNPKEINHGNQLNSLADDLFSDRAVFEEVKDIVSSVGGQTVTDPEELRKLINDQLGELYITTLPLQSIQRMFLHRQNIAGASTDLIRSFQHAAFHMAYQHARFKFAPRMDDQLMAAKSMVDSLGNNDEKALLSDYLFEINKKYRENVLRPPPSNWLTNKLSNMNFLWYLTAPASAIVNMMAVPSIALPVLGGKFGTGKSWGAITRYMKLLSGSGWKDETGAFDAPSIGRSKNLTDIQKQAYAAFSENLLEQSLAHDAASLAENPSLDYTGRWGRVMQIATFPFHKAERFNREITAMAAFDLAYEKNGGDFDAAIKEASDLTWKTMFDYATYNKPRYMQGNVAKILFAFKQYSQHMTYLLFRTAYEATQGVSKDEHDAVALQYGPEAAAKYVKETNELKSQARKQFMLLMGMSFVFAGATGLPIWWMYSGMANAFHAVFGDSEEPYDVENEFKNSMNIAFGGFVGDSISRGVIPQLTGASLSDRMSTNLPDMWFRDTKKNQDEVSAMQNALINLMGPSAGMLVNSAEALKRFNDGNTERAFEAIAPGAFKNLLAGSRLATEGALTMKGDTLIADISGKEAFLQMLGFTPERLAQHQSANIEAKSYEQAVNSRKQDLLNFLAMAIERDDEDGEAKVLAKIEDFNNANEWNAIKGSTIRSSLKKRAKEKAMSDELGGLRVNKKFADLAEEKTAYANEEEE